MSRELLPARFVPEDLLEFVGKIVSSPGSSEVQIRKRIRAPRGMSSIKRGALLFKLIEVSGDRLHPTDLGKRLVSAKEDERGGIVLRDIVLKFDPYSIPLRRMVEDRSEAFSLVSPEFKEYWVNDRKMSLSKDALDKSVNTFFKLLEFAGLGGFWSGRHGKPTRLELTNEGFGILKEAFMVEKGAGRHAVSMDPGGAMDMQSSTGMPSITNAGRPAPGLETYSLPIAAQGPGAKPELRYQVHRSKDGSVVLYIEPTERSIKFLELLIPVLKNEVEERED